MTSSLSIPKCKYNPNKYGYRGPFMIKPIPSCKMKATDLVAGPTPGKCGYAALNPQLYKSNMAKNYCQTPACVQIIEGKCKIVKNPCPRVGWTSQDARLKNPRTGNVPLVLDTPPMDMSVRSSHVYDRELDNWSTGFKDYKDIQQGQITYYVDKSIAPPFHGPLFQNEAMVVGAIEVLPMNSIEPRYKRIAKPANFKCTCTSPCQCMPGGLSFMRDTGEQREMIIASQMGSQLKKKWTARWVS